MLSDDAVTHVTRAAIGAESQWRRRTVSRAPLGRTLGEVWLNKASLQRVSRCGGRRPGGEKSPVGLSSPLAAQLLLGALLQAQKPHPFRLKVQTSPSPIGDTQDPNSIQFACHNHHLLQSHQAPVWWKTSECCLSRLSKLSCLATTSYPHRPHTRNCRLYPKVCLPPSPGRQILAMTKMMMDIC